MYKNTIFLLLLALLALTACQKEEALPATTSCDFPDRLAKFVYYSYNGGQTPNSVSFRMIYDEEGLLRKTQQLDPTDNNFKDHEYFEYDAQGQCIKHSWKVHPSAPTRYYEYDYQNGQRTTTRYYSSISPNAPVQLAQTTSFFYDGAKLVKIENAQPQFGNPPSVGHFEYSQNDQRVKLDYYPDGSGDPEVSIYHYNTLTNPVALLELYFGYPDNTLLLDTLQRQLNPTVSSDYQYQLDAQGRVSAKLEFMPSTGAYEVIERYYYDCTE